MNLGDNGALPAGGDAFFVDNSGNTDNGTTTDWGVNGVDLTGDGNLDVALVGVEKSTDFALTGTAPVTGTNTGDPVNAGGSTATGGRSRLTSRSRLVERHDLSVPDRRFRQRHDFR